ncbi:hypothetical protein KJ959_02395, partial [bacterium]|nr:hypothetical protein [bacterium]
PFGREVLRKERVYLPLNIGFAAQNIFASELNTGLESEALPLNTHLFVNSNLFAGGLCLYYKKSLMDTALRNEARTAMGMELRMSDEVVIRAGKDDFAVSYGAGITFGRFFLDIAAINGESGSRMALSAGFKFSYISSVSEQIISEKEAEIKKLAKELAVLKDSSGSMTDEERDWLLKMLAQMQKDIAMRDFAKAAATINTILARYGNLLKEGSAKLTKSEARKLAGKARSYMEQGNYSEAKKLILEALNVLRGDVSVEEISYLIDAHAAVAEGKYALARAVLAEGIIINPGSKEMIQLMKRIDKFMYIVQEGEK